MESSSGKEVDQIHSISAAEAIERIEQNNQAVFDVRNTPEYLSEHVLSAETAPLDALNDHLSSFPSEGDFLVHCAGGYRSVIASSILKSRGIHNLIDVAGGFKSLQESGAKTSDYVCPSTL